MKIMAERKKIIIIGAGGFAREVLDIFDACNDAGDYYDVLGYVVESRFGDPGTSSPRLLTCAVFCFPSCLACLWLNS
jgi:hypothetical protein